MTITNHNSFRLFIINTITISSQPSFLLLLLLYCDALETKQHTTDFEEDGDEAMTPKMLVDLRVFWQTIIVNFTTYHIFLIMIKCLFVGCLLNVPATCECISGTDLLRQFYVLPHWDRSCRSHFPSHPVTVYWHPADQSQRWPYKARRLAG